jgi:hypothetical protein
MAAAHAIGREAVIIVDDIVIVRYPAEAKTEWWIGKTYDRVASLEEAKAEFETSWKQWKAWAGMEEVG